MALCVSNEVAKHKLITTPRAMIRVKTKESIDIDFMKYAYVLVLY